MYNFEPYNVLLSIATNIAVLLMTASVLQGHRYDSFTDLCLMFCSYRVISQGLLRDISDRKSPLKETKVLEQMKLT